MSDSTSDYVEDLIGPRSLLAASGSCLEILSVYQRLPQETAGNVMSKRAPAEQHKAPSRTDSPCAERFKPRVLLQSHHGGPVEASEPLLLLDVLRPSLLHGQALRGVRVAQPLHHGLHVAAALLREVHRVNALLHLGVDLHRSGGLEGRVSSPTHCLLKLPFRLSLTSWPLYISYYFITFHSISTY